MQKSEALFSRAQQTIPGGVNSPVRAFKAVGGTPRFITKADGPYIWDADGKQYIDYVQRSEEHTSELQSPIHLVCRLLLEIGRASCRERV